MSMSDETRVIVNQLNGSLRTLQRYRNTSIALHNRVVPGFDELASRNLETVMEIDNQYPDDPEIQRWVAKWYEYTEQHNVQINVPDGER